MYRLLKTRQLPAFKLGRDWRLNVETIDRWRMANSNIAQQPHQRSGSRPTRHSFE
ncbi:MAG: hypothetical protein JO138_03975 [Acidobacteriaceae bacterium]|nr:hypothetical protein [Acidobacteriaceae bacterium]